MNKQFPEIKDSNVDQTLDCILGQMTDSLAKGGRVEIRGFGSFSCRHRPPRIALNTKTGATFKLPAKVATHFSQEMQCGIRSNVKRLAG